MRWGILATGAIAKTWAEHLRDSETGELVAVGSRTQASADAFGAPRAHGSYEALLADDDVEAVYIATPHPMHAEWTIRAVEAGKHVLCEKPFAMSVAEAEAMIDAARTNGVFLMEAFMYRSHPQTARLREQLPTIGEVQEIEAVHSFSAPLERLDADGRLLAAELGGGAILDVGCYCVSGALLAAGAEPVEVTGSAEIGATGVDLRANATLRFASGAVAHLVCGITKAEPAVLRIRGTEGTITLREPWLPRSGSRALASYEADEVARCVAAGLQESPTMPWSDTLAIARVLDSWRAAVHA